MGKGGLLQYTLQGDVQMGCGPIDFRRVHFHFIAQGVAGQFEGARRGYHTQIIYDAFADKMDASQGVTRFKRAYQHLPAPDLCADEFPVAVCENLYKATLPMRFEPFGSPIVTLLGALFIGQCFRIAACEDERYTMIEGSHTGKVSAPFAFPGAFEEVQYLGAGHGWRVHGLIVQQKGGHGIG
jgi:hypothetical protein